MPFDDAGAKAVLASLLKAAGGQVGQFVSLSGVTVSSGLKDTQAAVLDELVIRRWIHIRNDSVAATKWGLEFAMDWAHFGIVPRAILNSSGRIGGVAEMEVVIAAAGLPDMEVKTLVTELAMLGLADELLIKHEGRPSTLGAAISAKGWEYLTTGAVSER